MTTVSTGGVAEILRDLGVKRSAMSIITGRCGSTLVGEVCRQLRFGDGVETLNALAMNEIQPHEHDKIVALLRPAVVDGVFYHQTTYHRWQKLKAFVPPHALGEEVTLIFRRNVLAQAISYVNAISTGKWHSTQAAVAPTPMTDDQKTQRGVAFVKQILSEEKHLRAAWPESPVFYYEEIVTSPLESMQRFFTYYQHPAAVLDIAAALRSDAMTRKLVREGYAEQYEQLFGAFPGAAEMLWNRFNA